MNITVAPMLRILPNRTVIVPGCEPPSAVSSLRFCAWYQHNGCDGGAVNVDLILAAIPGSEIVFGTNYGVGHVRTQWLRLPGRSDGCPCPPNVDYYGIIKRLPKFKVEEPVVGCEIETSDWCMGCESGDVALPATPDPYFPMGNQNNPTVQTLTQIPPYMID